MMRFAIFLCLVSPALAQQQAPPRDPAVQLQVCQQVRAIVINDWEIAQTYQAQGLMTEIADLKKKLAEAEAKVLKSKDEPAPN